MFIIADALSVSNILLTTDCNAYNELICCVAYFARERQFCVTMTYSPKPRILLFSPTEHPELVQNLPVLRLIINHAVEPCNDLMMSRWIAVFLG